MTPTTRSIQEQSVQMMECDIPDGVTLSDYRSAREHRGPSRWERTRVGLLGAGLLGLVAETLRGRR